MNVINERVKSNTFEIWEIGNNSMLPHPFHIHNTQFKVLARSGRNISATERGLKDTILVYPQESVRLLIPFPGYSDAKRPYMYHCHILEHEDGGMMGQFTVS
jgi:FtsP/CotA-like multicopper oxidase with cupredoxin domain